MPTFIAQGGDRETVTLHAPWWAELEHVVVYAQATERDEQWISKQIIPQVRPGQGRDKMSITMDQTVYSRRAWLFRMITEITDAEGRQVPKTFDLIDSMIRKDSEWIFGEIEELNKSPIEPTDDDEADAERSEGNETPTSLAVSRFRRARH